jgi:flagellar basal body-associated protein FliL
MSILVGIILIVFICVLAGISIVGWMYESHKNEVLGSAALSMVKTISEQEQKIKKLESWVKILETNAKEEMEVDLDELDR